jgi:hypothetical protein
MFLNFTLALPKIKIDEKFENALNIVNSIDSLDSKEKSILAEKRRRYQSYMLLDFFLSNLTYFDFFCADTLDIFINARYLVEIANQNQKIKMGSEILLYSFLISDSEMPQFLKEHDITEKKIGFIISTFNKIKPKSLQEKKNFYFQKFFGKSDTLKERPRNFLYETNLLFEKASDNAIFRFKTPIITPEILFLTMMEDKNNKIGKIIKTFFKDETEWYLLRYKLIKKIHMQEIGIKNQVKKNENYFAYLLKSYLSEAEFNSLIKNNSLGVGVSLFRTKLIRQLLSIEYIDRIEKEIYKSILVNNKRVYST